MIPLPDPLHPAVVHFPIALLLLAAPLALASLFVRRWHLPWLAAVCLSLGAIGSFVATATGEADGEAAEKSAPAAENAIETHEEWGERARNAAALGAILAIASAALSRRKIVARSLAALAASTALAAAYSVSQAGHSGGALVFKHGVGVTAEKASASITPPEFRRHDED